MIYRDTEKDDMVYKEEASFSQLYGLCREASGDLKNERAMWSSKNYGYSS